MNRQNVCASAQTAIPRDRADVEFLNIRRDGIKPTRGGLRVPGQRFSEWHIGGRVGAGDLLAVYIRDKAVIVTKPQLQSLNAGGIADHEGDPHKQRSIVVL